MTRWAAMRHLWVYRFERKSCSLVLPTGTRMQNIKVEIQKNEFLVSAKFLPIFSISTFRASLSLPRPPHWATASDGRHLSLPGGTSYLPSHYIFVRLCSYLLFTSWYAMSLPGGTSYLPSHYTYLYIMIYV